MGERHVAVRAQADLQVVVAERREDRVVRIGVLAAARRGRELGRQRDRREHGIEPRMEEVRDRQALAARGRALHAMLRRAQVAARRGLQHLAEIHDVRARLRRRVDELAVELDLQAADVVLQHERHEARVVVHADALAVCRAPRGCAG